MNELTRVDSFNAAVRSIVTIALTSGFLYGFYVNQISGEVFTTMFATVLGFWFGSRDAKSRATDQPTTTVTTPDTKVVTEPTTKGTA